MSVQTAGAPGTVEHYRMPDAGEGLTEAEIVSWQVKVGDVIKVNDVVVEIETAKSLVELPSPYAGEVTALLVPEGETVVFSAHGVSPAVREEARRRRLTVIDATCPLVAKVHAEARRFASEGFDIVLIGHEDHEEI